MFTTRLDNGIHRSHSLLSFDEYKERESKSSLSTAVTPEGSLLDRTVLELRVNPPNVEIDNTSYETATIITVDSANRPGTLVEVVQCLTELNLVIKGSQISSDGGWFVDVFLVTEINGAKVTDEAKSETIRKVLQIEYECEDQSTEGNQGTKHLPASKRVTTVFELGGEDKRGILMQTTNLLQRNGCDVRSLAAWTQNHRGAVAISATEGGQPITDTLKISRLSVQLHKLLATEKEAGIVNIRTVKGHVHHERRLHRILLQEVDAQWKKMQGEECRPSADEPLETSSTAGHCSPTTTSPRVTITDWPRLSYWRVTIRCTDRPKLFFDTLCTLADLDYDVYHATASSNEGLAFQDFYIRPRFGDVKFQQKKADHLTYMLEASIRRRFPHGLKVIIVSADTIGLLSKLTAVMYDSGIAVSRAKVAASQDTNTCGHTFYVTDDAGEAIDPDRVISAFCKAGGRLTGHLSEDRIPSKLELTGDQFNFAIPDSKMRGKAVVGSPSSSMGCL